MPTRVRRHASISMTIWLLLIWLAVFRSLDWLTVLGGLLVVVLVQLIFPLPSMPGLWHLRPFAFLHLLGRFIWDLVWAGAQVSWIVVSGRHHDDGIVKCSVRSSNPVYITIVAAMTSMVPGTIVIQASREEHALYLHVLDLPAHGGIEGVRQEVLNQERLVLLAFAPNSVLEETGVTGAHRHEEVGS